MVRWTAADFAEYSRKSDAARKKCIEGFGTPQQFVKAVEKWVGSSLNEDKNSSDVGGDSTIIQKSKANRKEPLVHRAKNKISNDSNRPQFRVSIAISYPDRRRRDLDGATSAILDCLTIAVRRLLDGHTTDFSKRRIGANSGSIGND